MKKPKKTLLFLFIFFCALIAAGRFYGRYETLQYGSDVIKVMSVMDEEGMKNPERLHGCLADPDIENCAKRVRQLSFLTIDYQQRIDDLQKGLDYMSEQCRLPEDKRFTPPLETLKYLQINPPADHTMQGIASATFDLLKQYMLGI